jgi:predicted XRE-type DNA-binding protein
MSKRLDRVEALVESNATAIAALVQQAALTQQQISILVGLQQDTDQVVQSLAKSVQAHCDDPLRHN